MRPAYEYPHAKLRRPGSEPYALFRAVHARAHTLIAPALLTEWTERTLERLARAIQGQRVVLGWSGGKDSQVLLHLAHQLGITAGVHILCDSSVEYPAMERWYDAHRPAGITVLRTTQDLAWVARHPDRLFTTKDAGWNPPKWALQHAYIRQAGASCILYGRRRVDGNHVPADGWMTSADGTRTFNAIFDWDHETLFAYLHSHAIPLPPCYGWEGGYVMGTSPWPRRHASSHADGWQAVAAIDPTLPVLASPWFSSAHAWCAAQQEVV